MALTYISDIGSWIRHCTIYMASSAKLALDLGIHAGCFCREKTWPRGYKNVPCSNQLSTKFIMLINVKIPTVVGILTFVSMINATYERLKARNFFICRVFSFMSS